MSKQFTVLALQTERAFTPPLLANMGDGGEPDIRNITSPRLTSFNNLSWAAVTEEVSAHSVGGLRFSSFRLAWTLQLAVACQSTGAHAHVFAASMCLVYWGSRVCLCWWNLWMIEQSPSWHNLVVCIMPITCCSAKCHPGILTHVIHHRGLHIATGWHNVGVSQLWDEKMCGVCSSLHEEGA